MVSSHSGTPLGVGTSHKHFGPRDTPRPGPREYATTILPIVYSATLRRVYIQVAQIPGTPEMESRNCPEIVSTGLPELWTAITLDCWLGSQRGLNRSCSPRRDLSNAMSHDQIGCQEGIDSRLLVVGSQTPDPSFAHNLGCRCPNCQCEGIFDMYVLRPFQRHQEHPNARCFAPCCRALNIRESRRTPNPRFFQVLGFTPTLGQSRVATPHHRDWLVVEMERFWHLVGVNLASFTFSLFFSFYSLLPSYNFKYCDVFINKILQGLTTYPLFQGIRKIIVLLLNFNMK